MITCPNKMAEYLEKEVKDLGYPVNSSWATGLETEGTLAETILLNLSLRTGNQVLYMLKEFEATTAQDLYDNVISIPWEELIDQDGYLCVTSNVATPAIDNSLFANVKCKDAIVDRIKEKKGIRPDSGPERNKTVVHIYWKEEQCAIYIDSSGETLAKHGYRKFPHKAPMQENLAAATILSTNWDPQTNFVNPMCGSGTLAIEAALIALNKVPGLFRANYGFMHIKNYEDELFESIRIKVKEQAKRELKGKIIASDIDKDAILAAKNNARTAGVDHLIEFSVCDFTHTEVPPGPGVVMFNPEYGERMGEYEELMDVYKAIGDFLKSKCKGYNGYIFSASPGLVKKVGLKASRKIPFFNSILECRLLEYELYEGTRRTDSRSASLPA